MVTSSGWYYSTPISWLPFIQGSPVPAFGTETLLSFQDGTIIAVAPTDNVRTPNGVVSVASLKAGDVVLLPPTFVSESWSHFRDGLVLTAPEVFYQPKTIDFTSTAALGQGIPTLSFFGLVLPVLPATSPCACSTLGCSTKYLTPILF